MSANLLSDQGLHSVADRHTGTSSAHDCQVGHTGTSSAHDWQVGQAGPFDPSAFRGKQELPEKSKAS